MKLQGYNLYPCIKHKILMSAGYRYRVQIVTMQNTSLTQFLNFKDYNLTQLISRFACLYLKESKCSMLQDGNFTNNLTLLILFILFHDC